MPISDCVQEQRNEAILDARTHAVSFVGPSNENFLPNGSVNACVTVGNPSVYRKIDAGGWFAFSWPKAVHDEGMPIPDPLI